MKRKITKQNILAALVLGLILGYCLEDLISSEALRMRSPMQPVVIASAKISPGTVLRHDILQVSQWPQELLPLQAAKKKQEVEGKVITLPISKGEPVLLPQLAPIPNRGNSLKINQIIAIGSNIFDHSIQVIRDWRYLAADLNKLKNSITLAD